jgi:hypothetical protein
MSSGIWQEAYDRHASGYANQLDATLAEREYRTAGRNGAPLRAGPALLLGQGPAAGEVAARSVTDRARSHVPENGPVKLRPMLVTAIAPPDSDGLS